MYRFDFSVLGGNTLAILAEGMLVTLRITGTALVAGLLLGALLAVMRGSRSRVRPRKPTPGVAPISQF